MKTIKNLTRRPLRVPLPRNKTLHLGPGKSGQISTEAADHGGLKKMIEAGEVEVSDEAANAEGGGGGKGPAPAQEGHSSGGVSRRSGDR